MPINLPIKKQNRPDRPWYKKWWIIVFIAVIIITAGLFLILAQRISVYLKNMETVSITNLNTNSNQAGLVLATDDDPSAGSIKARVEIVEFGDFKCPHCREAYFIVREMMNEYSDQIYFVFRDFPVTSEESILAAEAGECAQEQGENFFWLMHDKMFLYQDDLSLENLKAYALQAGLNTDYFNECLDSGKYAEEVEADQADGLAAGVTGTPTFFINGYRIPGVIARDKFRETIDSLLNQ